MLGRPSKQLVARGALCTAIASFAIILQPGEVLAGGDEGRVIKMRVYNQTSASGAVLHAMPYRFLATVRNSVTDHTGTVLAPLSSTWIPNPFTVVSTPLLVGAHFHYDQGFLDQASLNQAFPDGQYVFGIARTYSAATTQFDQPVEFTGGDLPLSYPQITSADWQDGALWVHPSEGVIHYTPGTDVGFGWGLVGGDGSGGGGGSGAPGSLNLKGILRFGQVYAGTFAFNKTESANTVIDPNAPAGSYQQSSTYSAIKSSEVRFTLKTTVAPAGFVILEAVYTSAGQNWNVKNLLDSQIQGNSIVWRMEERDLTNNSQTHQTGQLYVKYENADGAFAITLPYDPNTWENYLIVPHAAAIVVPVSFTRWAQKFFTSTEMSDLSIWGLGRDPDGDGMPNLTEFAFGLHPRAVDTVELREPRIEIIEDGSGDRWPVVSYRRSLKAEANFAVQQSLNLSTWPILNGTVTIGSIAGEPTVEKVTVRSSAPVDWLPQQFFRVAITDPNPPPVVPPPPLLEILEARYGALASYNDVRNIIISKIIDHTVTLRVNNSTMGGDPIFGTVKSLFVRYKSSGSELTKTVTEGQMLILP